jgi:DNA-binding transcriptional ArsR family regulator
MKKKKMTVKDCVERLDVLADKTRLAVLKQLLVGEQSVTQLNARLDISQSLLSHHLKILRDHGFVVTARSGKMIRYRVAPDRMGPQGSKSIDLECCKLTFKSLELGSKNQTDRD